MKHISFVKNLDGFELNDQVNNWISENEENILEIIDIEYNNTGDIYFATITYEERT